MTASEKIKQIATESSACEYLFTAFQKMREIARTNAYDFYGENDWSKIDRNIDLKFEEMMKGESHGG